MKYCSNCGKEINENADVCVRCGKVVKIVAHQNNASEQKWGFAIASFVCSWIGIFSFLGIIFGIVGIKQNKTNGGAKGLSIAGLVIGFMWCALILAFIVLRNTTFDMISRNGKKNDFIYDVGTILYYANDAYFDDVMHYGTYEVWCITIEELENKGYIDGYISNSYTGKIIRDDSYYNTSVQIWVTNGSYWINGEDSAYITAESSAILTQKPAYFNTNCY